MFNYNPTVNDRSGEITAGYQTKSAEIKAAGNEALAKGIADGVTNLAGGITGAITKSQANTAKLQGVQATGMALGQALQAELGKAGNNPDKMAGAMMAFMPAMENLQARYNQNAQYTQALQLARQKAALGGGGSNPFYSVELDPSVDTNQ
jgi:hypothetical protein